RHNLYCTLGLVGYPLVARNFIKEDKRIANIESFLRAKYKDKVSKYPLSKLVNFSPSMHDPNLYLWKDLSCTLSYVYSCGHKEGKKPHQNFTPYHVRMLCPTCKEKRVKKTIEAKHYAKKFAIDTTIREPATINEVSQTYLALDD